MRPPSSFWYFDAWFVGTRRAVLLHGSKPFHSHCFERLYFSLGPFFYSMEAEASGSRTPRSRRSVQRLVYIWEAEVKRTDSK